MKASRFLQSCRADRLNQDHPDFPSLRILILLDPDLDNDLVKDTDHDVLALGSRNGDGVIFRIKVMRVLLECNQSLQTQSVRQPCFAPSRASRTWRQRRQDRSGKCE
jgi:hypothetical protein